MLDSHVIGLRPGRVATSWPLTPRATPKATSMRIQHISISKLDSYTKLYEQGIVYGATMQTLYHIGLTRIIFCITLNPVLQRVIRVPLRSVMPQQATRHTFKETVGL